MRVNTNAQSLYLHQDLFQVAQTTLWTSFEKYKEHTIFRAITDAIGVSKMHSRYVDENAKAVTFEEAFYMATKGGGEFFGKSRKL